MANIKYKIGDTVRTKINYLNDKRTEVEATIRGVELEDDGNIKYKIHIEPDEHDKKYHPTCTGSTGYVDQDDIIKLCKGIKLPTTKVFISHPMSDLSEEEVMKLRDEAKQYLEDLRIFGDIEIIDNYTHPDAPKNAGRLWHLGRSIQMMEEADVIFFYGNWGPANGCIIERMIVSLYNLPTITKGENNKCKILNMGF